MTSQPKLVSHCSVSLGGKKFNFLILLVAHQLSSPPSADDDRSANGWKIVGVGE